MTDKISELEKLASLRKGGLLSDSEFENEKLRILNPVRAGPQVNRLLPIGLAILALVALGYGAWKFSPQPTADPATSYSADTATQSPDTPPAPTDGVASGAAPAVSPVVKTADSIPEIGNCHMGECSWSKLEAVANAGKSPLGSLFKLELIGGVSEHPSVDDYPTSFSSGVSIKWDNSPHTVYVFCSFRLPAVLMETENGTQIDVLDFADSTGLPDVLISSANIYSLTCHMSASAWTKPDFASGYGYSSPAQYGDLVLSKPTDILRIR